MVGVTGLQKACVMHPAPGSGGVDGVWGGAGTQELYNRALAIKSAIPHPRIMAIIRECGGKMHMHDRAWSSAATAFFEVLPPPPNPSIPVTHASSHLTGARTVNESVQARTSSADRSTLAVDPAIAST